MTEKNPFDMSYKEFQEYLKQFPIFESDSKIAKGKNVSGVRFRDKPKGIDPQKWSETDIAKAFYKEYSERPKKDTIKKAHGGYVKKYAKGGGVRKVRT
jgi:hypothetical protein